MSGQIYPKCENGHKLYIASSSQVRPCCWLNEQQSVCQDKEWNMHNNSLDHILEVELKKFVENIKLDPIKYAPNQCWKKCNKPFANTANPHNQYLKYNEETNEA